MKLNLIVERDSRSYGFDYTNWKTDPRPNVLFLGSWVHPKTGNRLICACNMNYLNSEQMNRLQTFLPQIFAAGSGTKKRVNDLEALAPDIFDIAYRTYDIKYVAGISKGRIPHITLSPQGVEYEKEKAAEMGIPEPALEPTPEPEAVAPAPPPAPAPAEPSPVPAPAPEAPPAPQTPPAAQKPEEEPEEKPVKKEPEFLSLVLLLRLGSSLHLFNSVSNMGLILSRLRL